jgi:hypothetical protein
VFVHPTAVADDDRPGYSIPNFIAEYPFDTTSTIISLIFNGLFERHRHGWHCAHAGGTIPMLGLRLTATADAAKAFGPVLGLPSGSSVLTAKPPARALRTSFVDTALVADQPALAAAKKMAGASQIVFGSDWPFASRLYDPKGDPQPTLSDVFAAGERRAIDRPDARGEFPRLARFVPRVPDEAAGDASGCHRRNVPRDHWVSLPAARSTPMMCACAPSISKGSP